MTNRLNLYIDQGVDFGFTLNLTDDLNQPLNTSTSEFFSDVRKVYSSSTISFEITVTSETDGELSISVPRFATANTDPGKYQYDIIMKTEQDSTFKILEGLLFLLPTMSKIE